MTADLMGMFSTWYKNPPADVALLEEFKNKNSLFSESVLAFYLLSNGGEGFCGKTYISLWPLERIEDLKSSYQIQKYLGEGFLAIGSDGGGDCLAIRRSSESNNELVFVPFGDLDPKSVRVVGRNFSLGLENCFSGVYQHPD